MNLIEFDRALKQLGLGSKPLVGITRKSMQDCIRLTAMLVKEFLRYPGEFCLRT